MCVSGVAYFIDFPGVEKRAVCVEAHALLLCRCHSDGVTEWRQRVFNKNV